MMTGFHTSQSPTWVLFPGCGIDNVNSLPVLFLLFLLCHPKYLVEPRRESHGWAEWRKLTAVVTLLVHFFFCFPSETA